MTDTTNAAPFESWAIVELMGHVCVAGRVTEETLFGAQLGRIDIPINDTDFVTQYFGGSSVYRITPVTEDAARQVRADLTLRHINRATVGILTERATPTRYDDPDDDDIGAY